MIFPNKSLKKEYLQRFTKLNFTPNQINNFVENWDEMISECETCLNKIELSKNQYMADVIPNKLTEDANSIFEKFKQINGRLNLDTILTKPFDLNKKNNTVSFFRCFR